MTLVSLSKGYIQGFLNNPRDYTADTFTLRHMKALKEIITPFQRRQWMDGYTIHGISTKKNEIPWRRQNIRKNKGTQGHKKDIFQTKLNQEII